MPERINSKKITSSSEKNTFRLGFWSAVLITVLSSAALVIGLMTPPRSGPFCQKNCITAPYTEGAAFVPKDYLWMYPAICLALVFIILITCIHRQASENKKIFSQIGMIFGAISALLLSMNYYIQISVMQTSFLKGETEALSLFSQYNPHGLFIALEDLGYLLMSLAFLFLAFIFSKQKKQERRIRRLFIADFILATSAFIILNIIFGMDIEYLFECAIILINWPVLIISGILLSRYFKSAESTQ